MTLTSGEALTAIATSRTEASLALGRTSFGVLEASPDLAWCISGIPMAAFNAVVRCRLRTEAEARIDDVVRHFATRAMPFVWWVKGRDEDLEKRLRNHGLEFDGEESPGMAMALTTVPPVLSSGSRAATVHRVTGHHALRTWIETLLGSVEATVADDILELATAVFVQLSGNRASGWHFYLARIDDRPVGTSALHLETAAGLYSVGTLPSAQRRGVGTALSARALTDARSAGYSIATLTASRLGAQLYRSLGFTEYCRYREYVWRPRGIA